jgi:hypothetical protein
MADKWAVVGVFALVALLLSAGLVADPKLLKLSSSGPEPSYEGLHFAFIGLQPAGSSTVYTGNSNASALCLGNFASCGFVESVGDNGVVAQANGGTYSWQYGQTQATVTYCGGVVQQIEELGSACVSVSVTPATQQQSLVVAPISYSLITSPNGTSGYKVNGNVYLTQMQVTLAVPAQSSNVNTQFRGDTLWFAVYASGWNNAQEGGPVDGATWSTPILTEFLGASTPPEQGGTVANNYATNPGTSSGNEPVDLWPTPQTSSSFGGLLATPNNVGQVNASLADTDIDAPDSSMLPYGFFPVTLTNFGSYGCGLLGLYECDNTLQLKLETYTLQLGTYTWNNPITQSQTTQQANCQGGCPNPPASLAAWLSSPWGILTTIILIGVVVAVVAVVIVIAVKEV